MKFELSDKFLRAQQPPESGRREISDSKCSGLRLRVHPTGRMSWIFEKRVKHGAKRKHLLGHYPDLGLSRARQLAREISVEAAQGYDRVLAAAEDRLKAESDRASNVSVSAVIDAYDNMHLTPNLRTGAERRRQLITALGDHLDQPIRSLTSIALQTAVDRKAVEGYPGAANRICAALSSFMNWSASRGYVDIGNAMRLRKPAKETPRDVVLSIEEVRRIWEVAGGLGPLWRHLVRLMIITAQRRGDIAGLRWSEVHGHQSRISIDASRTKNGRSHIVHLSMPALIELQSFQPRADTDLVFTTTGHTPVSGFSKVKSRLDKMLGDEFPDWRFHDLRTAFATAMADAGEPEGVVDRVLNHVASASSASAVARTYNRAELLPQRAAALDAWADMIAGSTY